MDSQEAPITQVKLCSRCHQAPRQEGDHYCKECRRQYCRDWHARNREKRQDWRRDGRARRSGVREDGSRNGGCSREMASKIVGLLESYCG